MRLCSLENAGIINYYKSLLVGEIHIPEILQYNISQTIEFYLVPCPKMYTLAEENKLRKVHSQKNRNIFHSAILLSAVILDQISCLSPKLPISNSFIFVAFIMNLSVDLFSF